MIENLIGSCFIVPSLETSTQEEVFEEMLDTVLAAGHITKRDRTAMKKLLVEREAQGSTGLGNGIAVPHMKSKKLKVVYKPVGVGSEECLADFVSDLLQQVLKDDTDE